MSQKLQPYFLRVMYRGQIYSVNFENGPKYFPYVKEVAEAFAMVRKLIVSGNSDSEDTLVRSAFSECTDCSILVRCYDKEIQNVRYAYEISINYNGVKEHIEKSDEGICEIKHFPQNSQSGPTHKVVARYVACDGGSRGNASQVEFAGLIDKATENWNIDLLNILKNMFNSEVCTSVEEVNDSRSNGCDFALTEVNTVDETPMILDFPILIMYNDVINKQINMMLNGCELLDPQTVEELHRELREYRVRTRILNSLF